jgi:hypothetical protein
VRPRAGQRPEGVAELLQARRLRLERGGGDEEQRPARLRGQRAEVLVLAHRGHARRDALGLGADLAGAAVEHQAGQGRQPEVRQQRVQRGPRLLDDQRGRAVDAGRARQRVRARDPDRAAAGQVLAQRAQVLGARDGGIDPHHEVGVGRDARALLEVALEDVGARAELGAQAQEAVRRRDRDTRAARASQGLELRRHELRQRRRELGRQRRQHRGAARADGDAQGRPDLRVAPAVGRDAARAQRREAQPRGEACQLGIACGQEDLRAHAPGIAPLEHGEERRHLLGHAAPAGRQALRVAAEPDQRDLARGQVERLREARAERAGTLARELEAPARGHARHGQERAGEQRQRGEREGEARARLHVRSRVATITFSARNAATVAAK